MRTPTVFIRHSPAVDASDASTLGWPILSFRTLKAVLASKRRRNHSREQKANDCQEPDIGKLRIGASQTKNCNRNYQERYRKENTQRVLISSRCGIPEIRSHEKKERDEGNDFENVKQSSEDSPPWSHAPIVSRPPRASSRFPPPITSRQFSIVNHQ